MARKQKGISVLKVVVLVLLVLGLLCLAMRCCRKYIKKEGFDGQKELVLVHMEGCPHCVTLLPKWANAAKENKTDINMRSVEMNEGDGPELCKKHDISGFPSILLLGGDGEKLEDYNGERTKDGILGFLKGV
jgi:thiol-disulfide isomerase/thioredoxin